MGKTALVIGKFLPPHRGHQLLIDFAANYPGVAKLEVLVAGLPGDPIKTIVRAKALREHYASGRTNAIVNIRACNDIIPQLPEDDPKFWELWVALIMKNTDIGPGGIIFASDIYGEKLAKCLGCRFVPVDVGREIAPMSGTVTRLNLAQHFHHLLPEMQKFLAKRVVLFGADSVGKTTMADRLAGAFGVPWVPEYARGYLNVRGTTITPEKMADIACGQYAISHAVRNSPPAHVVFFDTDLFTTVGYSRLFDIPLIDLGDAEETVEGLAQDIAANLYLVLDTTIPFKPDPQRYGGDKRQSDTLFWIDILEQFEQPYAVVKTRTVEDRVDEIMDIFIKRLGHPSLI